jgi:TRAP-type transport system periplasmic protein
MRLIGRKFPIWMVLAAAVAALTLNSVQAQDKVFAMKFAIPTVGDVTDQYAKNLAAAIERDTGGRIKPQVFSGGQLGTIPRTIEATQFGTIECIVLPPEFFVGVDERFEVMAAPGLVSSMEQAQRLVVDPALLKLMLGLGAGKGLHGLAMLTVNPNELVVRTPINHVADFKGRKIRVFASQFETVPFERLGATAVAMSLGDVVPALQQGTIDGALAGIPVLAAMHFKDAAKYVSPLHQPTVFDIVQVSSKWFDSLPPDLQQIVEKDAVAEAAEINPWARELVGKAFKAWTDSGGEVINLPPEEYTSLIRTFSAAAEEVADRKPAISATYRIVKDAAQRAQ